MPLLDLFWTTLIIFCWVLWFMLLFRVYGDLFARQDIGGWAKTGWVVLTLVCRSSGSSSTSSRRAGGWPSGPPRRSRQRAASDAYIRSVAADAEAEQMAKARDLLQSGAITPEDVRAHGPSVPAALLVDRRRQRPQSLEEAVMSQTSAEPQRPPSGHG